MADSVTRITDEKNKGQETGCNVAKTMEMPGAWTSGPKLGTMEQLHQFVGAWRSLVARLPWAQEVPGSNPGAPTSILKTLAVIQDIFKGTRWYHITPTKQQRPWNWRCACQRSRDACSRLLSEYPHGA